MKALEIEQLKQDILFLNENIKNSENYVNYLLGRYSSPHNTVRKYNEKIEKWKKERYELKQELVILENQPCNE